MFSSHGSSSILEFRQKFEAPQCVRRLFKTIAITFYSLSRYALAYLSTIVCFERQSFSKWRSASVVVIVCLAIVGIMRSQRVGLESSRSKFVDVIMETFELETLDLEAQTHCKSSDSVKQDLLL
eukprot:6016428-Amphidinium_carterae.1